MPFDHNSRVKELEEYHKGALKLGNRAEAAELYKHLSKARDTANTINFHHRDAARHQAEIDRHTSTIKSGKLQEHQVKATQGVIDQHKKGRAAAMAKAKEADDKYSASQHSEGLSARSEPINTQFTEQEKQWLGLESTQVVQMGESSDPHWEAHTKSIDADNATQGINKSAMFSTERAASSRHAINASHGGRHDEASEHHLKAAKFHGQRATATHQNSLSGKSKLMSYSMRQSHSKAAKLHKEAAEAHKALAPKPQETT